MRTEIKRLLQVELLAFIIVIGCVVSIKLFGADGPVQDVPSWLKTAMDFIVSLPLVGPVVLSVLKWTGVVSAVMTGISTTVMAVATSLKVLGVALGFETFAERVDSIYKAVWPYIAFLSVYNVPKRVN